MIMSMAIYVSAFLLVLAGLYTLIAGIVNKQDFIKRNTLTWNRYTAIIAGIVALALAALLLAFDILMV
jgi:putative Mn2+ efflux pump MntP